MKEYLARLLDGKHLSTDDAADVMRTIMSGEATPSQIAGFLIALKAKGETVDEITGLVRVMRENMVRVTLDEETAVDTCGTGGDGSGTFNISTTAAIVAAAAGVKVAKHGNRSISSQCGSADILERLGVKIDYTAEMVQKSIEEIGIGFMFAPLYHPAMKHAAGPRRELGVRTVFNILGPLSNPAGVTRQVVGVFSPDAVEIMAETLSRLGSTHVTAFCSDSGADELTLDCANQVLEFRGTQIRKYVLSATDVGLTPAPLSALRGGTPEENVQIIIDILNGKKGPRSDVVALNAGAAICAADKARDLADGVTIARDVIESGAAKRILADWKAFSQDNSS
jgi:anthranilate phosphoribosyltransferase